MHFSKRTVLNCQIYEYLHCTLWESIAIPEITQEKMH